MVDYVQAIIAKKEDVYGQLPTVPATNADNGILTRNLRPATPKNDRIRRNLDTDKWGQTKSGPSNERVPLQYEVELAGSGAAGTAAPWMELLEAAGCAAPVLAAGVSATQKFALPSAVPSSLYTRYNVGDQRRNVSGLRGTFALDFTAGQYPFAFLDYLGFPSAVNPFQTSAPGNIVLTRWKEPVEVNNDNTDYLLDGYAMLLKSARFEANVATAMRNLVGARYVNRGNHGMRVRLVVEPPGIAAKDYISTLRSGAVINQVLTHGTVAGNIIEVTTPKLQIDDIAESEEDGKLMWTIDATATVEAGQDDFQIVAK